MKGTKRLSFLVAMIIAITNIAFIGIPSVGAEVISSIVSDDFETGYTAISSNAVATLASMQELCDTNPWWYSVKSTVFNKADDVKDGTPLIASVISAGDNNLLRLTYHAEAGIGTNIVEPAKANWYVYESGSYEVSFKMYTTGDIKILGIGGKQDSSGTTFYQHNILTKSGSATYMGDADASSPAGQAGLGISSNTWYTIKVVVNNDLGNYSVEILDKSGTSIQRVGGINIKDGCPAISNIRFQAPTESSVVYIDEYSAKKVTRENLLVEDDFNIYSAFSSTPQNYTVGANLFKEISQFRVQDKNSYFVLGADANDTTNKYLQLKASKVGTQYYPANAMYMPWNGYILTKDSQAVKGKLQLKFSYCIDESTAPKGTTTAFRVICADDFSASNIADLANDNYTMFRVQTFAVGGKPVYGMQKAEGDTTEAYQQIAKGTWYDVQLTFDLVNDKVNMLARERGTNGVIEFERSTSLYNGGTPLESIKSIMFKANDGMVANIDDVELKLIPNGPQVNVSGVEVTDFNGNKILADETGVNPAISTIKIPFTQSVTDESVENITLKAENSETAFSGYSVTNVGGVYTMTFEKTLEPNTKYTLSVPTTVTNAEGYTLLDSYTREFTTGDDNDVAEMAIKSVDVNGVDVKSVEDLANGDKIYVRMKYANTTNVPADCLMIIAYYDANNALLGSSSITGSLDSNSINMTFAGRITVPAAEVLDLSKVNKVSIYLWDSYGNIRPYCEHVDIFRATADSE